MKADIEDVFDKFGNMLYRISVVMLKNSHDAEDAVQDTMIRYMEITKEFADQEHLKAWLIRININICKNKLRFYRYHPNIEIDELRSHYIENEDMLLMEELMKLPEKYKEVLLLFYVEGYKIREISGMLKITESTVKKRLERGRKKLNEGMGGAENV